MMDYKDFCELMRGAAVEKRRHFSPGTAQFDAYNAEAEYWLDKTAPVAAVCCKTCKSTSLERLWTFMSGDAIRCLQCGSAWSAE